MPDVLKTVGRYEILRELGRGGMGYVYLARDLELDRLDAIKVLKPSMLAEDGMVAGNLVASDVDQGASLSFALTGEAPDGFSLGADGAAWPVDSVDGLRPPALTTGP